MDKTFKFTRARIEKLKAPEASGRIYYKDRDYPKLLLQITRSGAKSFYFRYWDPATRYTSKVQIGRFPNLLPDDARKRAVELAHELASGIDPAAKKRRARAAITFQSAFDSCMQRPHRKRERRQTTLASYEYHFRKHLSTTLARKTLSSITRTQVEALHDKIGTHNGKVVANQTLKLISLVFNDAIRKGWEGQNPCTCIVRYRERRRARFLEENELGPFIRACELHRDEGSSTIPDAVLLALFTGVRRRNVCGLRWEQIDLERRTWDIPAQETKNHEPHRVYLADYVADLLGRRFQQRQCDIWVFPTRSKSGHLVEPKDAFAKIVARAAINPSGVMFHCLRHTFITYADDYGVPSAVLKRLAGHSRGADVTAGYTHALDRGVRESFENVAWHMLKIARCG